MQNMVIEDIFDINNYNSVIRKILRKESKIRLEKIIEHCVEIPAHFLSYSIHPKNSSIKEIKSHIMPVCKKLKEEGINNSFSTAIYEVVLNAYQHGNKYDSTKEIRLSYGIINDSFSVIVEDEGDGIFPEFVSFVTAIKQDPEKFINFYDFIKQTPTKENLGTGTSFMHIYSDKVNYGRSKLGGLAVELLRKK